VGVVALDQLDGVDDVQVDVALDGEVLQIEVLGDARGEFVL
jgi:hypothetical protein